MNNLPPLDALGTAIVILNDAHQIAYINPSAEQLLGLSGRQSVGEAFFELIRGDLDAALLKQFATQEQNLFLEEVDLILPTGIVLANVMLSKYLPNKSNPRSFVMMEMQTSEQNAHIRKDIELQHQSRVSTHLIRNLAHEIKNPLGGIKGAAQLLERKLPDDISEKYTQIIIQEADRLSELVSRMLLPAEPEAQSLINPHQLFDQALQVLALQANHEIKIIRDYDPSLPDLLVSAGQIQQVLMNLIKNAMEAIKSSGEIKLRTRILHQHTIGNIQHRQVIRMDVLDSGEGIPKELVKDIFFPTISGKNSSGLGLSIAQSFAQQHGGIIELENDPSYTCFSLYLPLATNL